MSAPKTRTGPSRPRGAPRQDLQERRAGGHPRPAAGTVAVDGLVIGPVPTSARVTGMLLLLSGLVGAAAPFLPYLVVGGTHLRLATGLGSALVELVVPVVAALVGAGLAGGRVPKFGLAYAGVGGALAIGNLLIELYRGSTSTARPAVEVLAGRQVLTSTVVTQPGWVLGVVALALAVAAGCGAVVAWERTVMEDGGGLDPARSGLAGVAVLLSVATVLCLTLPAADLPDRVVTDPTTGLQTVVAQEGPQALLDRPELALLGGLLLAGAVVLCSVVAPSLRPRLAVVGGLLAITTAVLEAGLAGLRDAVSSAALEWTVPGGGLLLAGILYALLTLAAWRVRRRAPANASS